MAPPNIVLITVDSLRADRVGVYRGRSEPSLTPNLDRLAAQAVVMERCHSQGPFTAFSMPSLFTGLYPCHLRRMVAGLRTGGEHQAGRVVTGTLTLTDRLHAAGYRTGGFHSNPLLSRVFGFNAGFDAFFDDVLIAGPAASRRVQLLLRVQRVLQVNPFLGCRPLNRRAIAWLEGVRQPFFLWVHYMDAHGPYLSRKLLRGVSPHERLWSRSWQFPGTITPPEREKLMANYARQIRLVDAAIARLFDAIGGRGLLDNTAWVITADHGDEFFEHGGYSHRHKLYRELTHVPMLVSVPGVPPGRHAGLSSLLQVTPTLLDVAGVPAPGLDAPSLLPALRGRPDPDAAVVSEVGVEPHETLAVRRGDWSLIWKPEADAVQLFHLPSDPEEKRDVAAQYPAEEAALLALLRQHLGEFTTGAADAAPLSESDEQLVEQRLRDLGYI